MAYTNKEKNIAGINGQCGCSNSQTKAFCQSDFCAELALDGSIIYRGEPNRFTSPPLRNEEGYANEGGTGYYDNVNKSVGHKASCNLQLTIDGVYSAAFCRDCENLNGTYNSTFIRNGAPGIETDDSLYTANLWFWPLCTPENPLSACGANYAYGYIGFDPNDGFNEASSTQRDVYFNVRINSLAIGLNPAAQTRNALFGVGDELCINATNFGGHLVHPTGCNRDLVNKRVKIGEIKWSVEHQQYYDSNVNCSAFDGLSITDTIAERPLCAGYNLSITSTPNDNDYFGYDKSISYQYPQLQLGQATNGYTGSADAGYAYIGCPDVSKPITDPSFNISDPSKLEYYYDADLNTDIYYFKPVASYKVTISGASAALAPINGEHRLTGDTYSTNMLGASIAHVKDFSNYDYEPKTDDRKPLNDCSKCVLSIGEICVNDIIFSKVVNLDTDELTLIASIRYTSGRRPGPLLTSAFYSKTIGLYSTDKFLWLDTPVTLDHTGFIPNTDDDSEFNFSGLTVTVENVQSFEEVTQIACLPSTKTSLCEGGKEPDALLVEFTDNWRPGYMQMRKYQANTDGPPTCYYCGNSNHCNGCFRSLNNCVGNCELMPDHDGPVGSFILTKVNDVLIHPSYDVGCNYNCNNLSHQGDWVSDNRDLIQYRYLNGTSFSPCQWYSIEVNFGRMYAPCDFGLPTPVREISINMSVKWASSYINNPQTPPGCFWGGTATQPDENCSYEADIDACTHISDIENLQSLGGFDPTDYLNDVCTFPGDPNRYFYKRIPESTIENFTYAVCDGDGWDLEPYYANLGIGADPSTMGAYVCTGEGASNNEPLHGHWMGGTVRVTPIYY